jgi:hypothetical protein
MSRANMRLEIIGARSDIVTSLTGILDGLESRVVTKFMQYKRKYIL